MYNKECESALLNRLGPGPAKYETQFIERDRFGNIEKNRFSIPKVSIILPIIILIYFYV